MSSLYAFGSQPSYLPYQQLQQYRNVTSYLSRHYPGLHANEWTCHSEDYCGDSKDTAFSCFPTPDRNVGRKKPTMPGYHTQICSLPAEQ